MNKRMKRLRRTLLITLGTVIGLALVGYGLLKLSGSREFQLYGGIVNHVETSEKAVALTFDDGPTGRTEEIVSILREEGVKATFFLTGAEMEANPEETKQLIEAGHEIGNHSYSHDRMMFKSPSFVKEEIEQTDAIIRSYGYEGPIPFRPPYGKKLLVLPYYLHEHDRQTILWDVEPDSIGEIAGDAQRMVDHTVEHAKPGSIILLHVMYESRTPSMQAVKGIIDGLRSKGYGFKTVSELMGE
ncbi:polysaccharide deacetylase family protein [Paenibacillus methanolicus]|uniref:Peptidoglycan/xylan/chitin deacetylase (PgdA/CDA1 family) n=1 Tax=Paenibacillus methanolicus TaxID=582686 RepID=A0A5S5C5T7_9BACL|nr:polysaccharide deacetylase family protein [Paenibacillus methanolicus]TYP73323.1 peptidoglycan/xylan/chitin deacetylase (PgdA/CDA1 family) [Paenibacillus methanolicus]